jgi:hypothetical protein
MPAFLVHLPPVLAGAKRADRDTVGRAAARTLLSAFAWSRIHN